MNNDSAPELPVNGMAPLLLVYDVPESVHFYCDCLGFELVQTSKPADPGRNYNWALLNLNGIELMMEPKYPAELRPPKRPSQEQDIIFYFGCSDVDRTYSLLSSRGINVSEPYVTGYGFKAIQLRDPDGFKLIFHWPQ